MLPALVATPVPRPGAEQLQVTHDIDEAAALADRVLEHGRIAVDLTTDLPHPRSCRDPQLCECHEQLLAALGVRPDGEPTVACRPELRATEGRTEMGEYLWYIPNTVEPGHRGDDTSDGWGTLDHSAELAQAVEHHGWAGALLGTGWGRPDTFTVAASLAARTTTFKPLIAIRPGYWHPANFASAAATLDQLSRGRVLVNVVSGLDNPASYGDGEFDQSRRYERTLEFLQLVRRLWSEEKVTFHGEHYRVDDSTVRPRPWGAEEGRHPRLYFGGASEAAEQVAAQEADVQLFWGEPLDGVAERIDRLRTLSATLERRHRPLEFGLRVTTVVRDTTEEAWRAAEEKVARMARHGAHDPEASQRRTAVGQRRLLDLVRRGEVLDSCLYTAPGRYGGGGAGTTWLVGSAQDVADALLKYRALGVTHFVLSDTPYRREIARVGDQLLPLLRQPAPRPEPAASRPTPMEVPG